MPKTTDRPADVTPSASGATDTEPDTAAPDRPARGKPSTRRRAATGARGPKTESATDVPVPALTADPVSGTESDASTTTTTTTTSAVIIDGELNAAQDPVEVVTATERELPGASPMEASLQDRVWEALRAHPGAPVAELATEARVSRSTVTALLDRWVTEGGVRSTPGVTARAARLWTAQPSGPAAAAGPAARHDTKPTAPPAADAAAGQGSRDLLDAEPASASDDTVPNDAAPGPEAGGALADETAGSPTTSAAPASPVQRRKASTNRSGSTRLGAGALRGMVEEYLTEHPGEHGPVEIGKAISRSSGAVANALEKLTESGWATRTSDKPKRYRIADSDIADTDTGTGTGTADAVPDGADAEST